MNKSVTQVPAITVVRNQFPALAVCDEGTARVYFDNPAGTQVPVQVVERIREYLTHSVANAGGFFRTTVDTTALVDLARRKMMAFCNANSADEIVFGLNMTSLTFHMTRTLEPLFKAGDEILLTRMDHDGNVTPWTLLAERLGLTVRWLEFDRESYRYQMDDLDSLITERTRLAAVSYASNITGTINDAATIARRVKAVGGLSYIDAVQFAAHGDIDVQALDCDFLACSAYKFYGPHVGVLWGRKNLLESLSPAKLKAASDHSPNRFETGTPNFEGFAGVVGAVEYYEWLGAQCGPSAAAKDQSDSATRRLITAGKSWMKTHEDALASRLLSGLSTLRGVRIHGLTSDAALDDRVSTISFSVAGRHPDEFAKALAERNMFAWSGDNYALGVINHLGLRQAGGVVRLGPVHYNTIEEVERVLECLEEILGS